MCTDVLPGIERLCLIQAALCADLPPHGFLAGQPEGRRWSMAPGSRRFGGDPHARDERHRVAAGILSAEQDQLPARSIVGDRRIEARRRRGALGHQPRERQLRRLRENRPRSKTARNKQHCKAQRSHRVSRCIDPGVQCAYSGGRDRTGRLLTGATRGTPQPMVKVR